MAWLCKAVLGCTLHDVTETHIIVIIQSCSRHMIHENG